MFNPSFFIGQSLAQNCAWNVDRLIGDFGGQWVLLALVVGAYVDDLMGDWIGFYL